VLNTWVASVLFKRRVWCQPMDLIGLSSFSYMRHRVLFHLEWLVAADGGWIVASGLLNFPLLFSLLIGNIHRCPLCFLLFNFSPHSISFLFRLFSIYRSFYSFQFSPSIVISHILIFHFNPYFLKFLIFSLTLLLKFFFFQFHPSIKFYVALFFLVWPSFFWFFFLLLKLVFNSIKPSNWKFLFL
jgi:hypothetical protein